MMPIAPAFWDQELTLATNRTGIQAQIYCMLQAGYFKAKKPSFI